MTVDETMLCAYWEPPYCERPVESQDMCGPHYRKAWARGELPSTFARRRIGHNLWNVDAEEMVGDCYVCGPRVPAYRTKLGHFVCAFRNVTATRLRKTGWDELSYDLAVIAQAGLCALCGKSPSGRGKYGALCADHCHATKARRRLLCGWCNSALGFFEDDPVVLRAAADYVS